jgi:bacteriocin-like protein
MTNFNETTSIETLSDDELSLVSGGCYGHYKYQGYYSGGRGQGRGGNAVAAANASASNVNVNDISNVNNNVNSFELTLVIG